jgi:integrase
LGSIAALSLAEAREKAATLRKHALNGRDPIHERDRDRGPAPTFREATKAAHKALKGGWADKNAAAFLSSLEEHAFPRLGDLRVDTIEASNVRDMLEPIWLKLPVMARKVRQRAGTVLNFAKSKGWRTAEAPGRSVTVGLARQPAGGNFDSMPYADVPAFMAGLRGKAETNGRLALMFQILTAARPGEVRSARWAHINLAKREWNRPASLMKGRVAHTVTLNEAAVALLTRLKEERSPFAEELVFPGQRGKPMSDMTLSKVLRDAKLSVDSHGFRSSFRDWAAEKMSQIPDPVAEAALAHVVPDKVVRAYKRTNFMHMRRELLDAWGGFITGHFGQHEQRNGQV